MSLVLQISLLTVFIHIFCPVLFNFIALFASYLLYFFSFTFSTNFSKWNELSYIVILFWGGGLVTSTALQILLTKNLLHNSSKFPVLPRLRSAHFVYQHTHTHASVCYASPTKFHKPSSSGLLVTAVKLNTKLESSFSCPPPLFFFHSTGTKNIISKTANISNSE